MPLRCLTPFVLLFAAGLSSFGAPAAGPAARPEDFVHVQKGTLPIILSAPHGGQRMVPDVPERLGVGVAKFTTVLDGNTAELTEKVAAELEKLLDERPWVVVARFGRKYVDANRPRDGAYESEKAKPYYDAYHGPLEAACKAVKEKHGRGLLLDIHGQGAHLEAICRGTQNGRSVSLLRDRFGWAGLTGRNSVLGRMERAGYKVLPACDADPKVKEEPAFTGGFITGHYGSHTGYGIDAIQLEFGSNLRQKAVVAKTAKDLADAIAAFHIAYLKDTK